MPPVVAYRELLRAPGVGRLFAGSLLARCCNGALGLLLVLRVRELGGDYGTAGIVAGAYALGLAVGAPLLGRAIDRRGQTAVLRLAAAGTASGLVALALLPHGAVAAAIPLAALTGATMPPVSSCARALWEVVFPEPARRHGMLALDATAFEATYVVVPAALVALAAVSAPAALGLAAGAVLAGTAWFTGAPASRAWRADAAAAPSLLGALAAPGVRVVVGVWVLLAVAIGTTEVAIAAFAEEHGARSATGLLLAAWGVTSMIGGLVAGRRAPREPVGRLAALLVVLGVAHAALALAGSMATLAVALLLAGLALAPAMIVGLGLLSDAAPPGRLTEASTWLATGLGVGIALGAAAGGALVDAHAAWAAFGLGAPGLLVAAWLVRARRADLGPPA
ncbi:MFS transporter [Patulibacter brassicae]|uniref:MFS transporter n=1 Tax=Patulibacter brassicae TaxID=1705717 RepID=A0ABU4VQ17_9ACTN|nr:MFS transporter [Patulibacter brassicae]MDX8153001.1 MFS transporter [Patulibacter brassicae]